MEAKGMPSDIYTDIHGRCIVGKVEEVLNLLNQLGSKGLTITFVTYTAMISGLSKVGRTVEAFKLYNEMLEAGFMPDDRVSVYKMLCRTAQVRLVSSHPEVYEPCDDSFALVDALLADRTNIIEHNPKVCMEVGSGSGYVITSLALMLGQEVPGVFYVATDSNPHAVRTTLETLKAHDVHAELICTDIASGLDKRLAGLVDVMVVNPPYVPTPEDEVGREGIASAWAGGENGRKVIDRILPVANTLLSDKGWLYMVTLAANDPSDICLEMRKKGYASRIVVQRSTEEESLHIVKFWRDPKTLTDAKDLSKSSKTVGARLMESLVSQLLGLSNRRNNDQ